MCFEYFQVFDVVLNGQHTVVEGLDIFAKVGRGVALDEVVLFHIKSGQLRVNGESSPFNGKLSIEFVKVCSSPAPSQIFVEQLLPSTSRMLLVRNILLSFLNMY